MKSRAWVANLACWQGIEYYYRKAGRQLPTFRDFLNRDARAWNYPEEAWAAQACGIPAGEPVSASLEQLAANAAVASEPLVQAALSTGA